ncbi:MAG: crossover junction endodeoxyribonuclease RuvC [Deltaproteobacteria bacterium]|nr:crossover junction endodeoxyribonuclease RuvC [Deltaproteobacteria bacterium]MBI2501469.1 crossover junction endodeoxyribonuclease RuvC [Deltaproteobacteria bacterium]
MKILGIDPGSQITGLGVIEKNGSGLRHLENIAYRVHTKDLFAERLWEIFCMLKEAIKKFRPDAVAIEKVFLAKNAMSALKLGEARGVSMLAAASENIPIYEYSTREVKQAVTGYGQATKEQIQKMVQQLLKLPEVAAEDASDALAVAICHMQSHRMKELLS